MRTFSSAPSQSAYSSARGVVYQTARVACSLPEFQPSPKWSGFKLQTFDCDCVFMRPSWSIIRTRGGTLTFASPWFWDQGESLAPVGQKPPAVTLSHPSVIIQRDEGHYEKQCRSSGRPDTSAVEVSRSSLSLGKLKATGGCRWSRSS
ncbi:unnamed protein product [Pleuronectes platessa]|uniref:Uncharacterized protein n=1 Tax=Pleuronectes platessa TaxID=8262 RepID=A0A9N7ZBD3_PLEPL|nr:unnamed protein product [Pleuronectes platessa]